MIVFRTQPKRTCRKGTQIVHHYIIHKEVYTQYTRQSYREWFNDDKKKKKIGSKDDVMRYCRISSFGKKKKNKKTKMMTACACRITVLLNIKCSYMQYTIIHIKLYYYYCTRSAGRATK